MCSVQPGGRGGKVAMLAGVGDVVGRSISRGDQINNDKSYTTRGASTKKSRYQLCQQSGYNLLRICSLINCLRSAFSLCSLCGFRLFSLPRLWDRLEDFLLIHPFILASLMQSRTKYQTEAFRFRERMNSDSTSPAP